nr:hypothetical protein [Tanacetum cinerariifolium]
MDFVTKLPRTSSGHDTIWVIVDRLTKSAHFLPMRKDYKMDRLARLYLNEIVTRHGVPISIISDHDSRFTSRPWKTCLERTSWTLEEAEVGEGQLIGPKLVQETTQKILQIKDRLKAVRDRQKSYIDKRRNPLEFSVGPVAYRLYLPKELDGVHDTFHVSNRKKCLADPTLQVPLDEIQVDAKLNFVEKHVKFLEREFKNLKRSRMPSSSFLYIVSFVMIDHYVALLSLRHCRSVTRNLETLGDFSFLKKLMLPELTPTCMTLELATRTVSYPAGIAEDVFVKVENFTFPADFVVVNYDVDPRAPIILRRPFLSTAHALVDVHGEELTLHVGDGKLVFNVERTSKYSQKHDDESVHIIDTLDTTCEDHSHEVLNVQKSINPLSGSPTHSSDPVVESLSLSLTPFEDKLLNDDPTPNLPPPLLVFEINKTKKIKTSIDDPSYLKLKDLPPHLEYAFLEGTSKLPFIIIKNLK